jgi:hypothetical protein
MWPHEHAGASASFDVALALRYASVGLIALFAPIAGLVR